MEFEDLKTLFQRFNRKERYHLVHYACGGFGVSRPFQEKVEEALEISLAVNKLWMAMDYHLDWISGIKYLLENAPDEIHSLSAGFEAVGKGKKERKNILTEADDRARKIIEGTQQDVDLLILGQDAQDVLLLHLVLVEAKLDSSWSNDQIKAKGSRLSEIFPRSRVVSLPGAGANKLKLHLLLMDKEPGLSVNLETKWLPEWAHNAAKVPHLQLPLAADGCDWPLFRPAMMEGNREKGYKSWRLEKVRGPKQ